MSPLTALSSPPAGDGPGTFFETATGADGDEGLARGCWYPLPPEDPQAGKGGERCIQPRASAIEVDEMQADRVSDPEERASRRISARGGSTCGDLCCACSAGPVSAPQDVEDPAVAVHPELRTPALAADEEVGALDIEKVPDIIMVSQTKQHSMIMRGQGLIRAPSHRRTECFLGHLPKSSSVLR